MLPNVFSKTSVATIGERSIVGLMVKANVAFESAIEVGTKSDVTFSYDQAGPGDSVLPDNAGSVRPAGKGQLFARYGRASVIAISDSRGQILNFLLDSRGPRGDIAGRRAHCALRGGENEACDTLPVSGRPEMAVLVGVEVTVGRGIRPGITPVDNESIPSFDMSIVYQ